MIKWKGDELKKKIKRAEAWGINRVIADTIRHALNNHPNWQYDTGVAEGSITQKDFATARSRVGRWGSIWSTHAPVGQLRKGRDGKTRRIGLTNYVWDLEFKHGPFMRAAADSVYPTLNKRIKEKLNK